MTRFWRSTLTLCFAVFIGASFTSILLLVMLNTQSRELATQVMTKHVSAYSIKEQLFALADYLICVVFLTIMNACLIGTMVFLECTGISFCARETTVAVSMI